MATKEREYLTAVTICGGIITLIDYNGNICYYRQRGITKFTDAQRKLLMNTGLLQRNWEQYKELPKHISISFEDPSVMGKARATYPNPEDIFKAFQSRGEIRNNNKKDK